MMSLQLTSLALVMGVGGVGVAWFIHWYRWER